MKKLISYFAGWWHFLRCVPHFCVVVVRETTGRFFYFRDRPDWFVQMMADQPIDDAGDAYGEQLRRIVTEARAERARRVDQHLRRIKEILPLEHYAMLEAVRDTLRLPEGR